jgi:tetratricopeptide (TPR) repeat protein
MFAWLKSRGKKASEAPAPMPDAALSGDPESVRGPSTHSGDDRITTDSGRTKGKRSTNAPPIGEDVKPILRTNVDTMDAVAVLARAAEEARTRRRGRRRIIVLVVAGLLMLGTSLTAGAWWMRHRRLTLREEVSTSLTQAARLREGGQFRESRELLEQAQTRLGTTGPSDLIDQVNMALADTRLVERLDTPRRQLFDNLESGSPLDFAETEREYATALNDAVLVREGEDKDVIAARVRNSSVRAAVLAAIQDWAAVTADEPRRAWLLAVACAADPDPDRDRLRRPELWRDRPALARLVGEPVPKSLSPELAVVLGRRAIAADVPGPVPLLVEVQRLHPQDYWLNVTVGLYFKHEQKWGEAIAYYRAALATRPGAALVHYYLGISLRGQRKLDESIEQFEEALRLDPTFANAHNGMGLVLHAKRKPDEAMEHYKEALRLNPKHVSAQVNLGACLAEKNLIDEAISNYEAALRINPRHAGAHYHHGNALRTRNELDRAIGQYQEAVNLSPRYAAAHNALGNAWHAKNQYDQAIPCYERALQIEPANAGFLCNLGNSLRLRGRLDEAITRFWEAVRIDAKCAAAHNGIGNVLSAKGNPDAALSHFEEAIHLDPENARFHASIGSALWALGRFDAAISHEKEAIRIDRKNSEAHNSLGSSFLAKGKVDQAIDYFEQAIHLDGKNSSAHSNLGIARLYGQGRIADASKQFSDAAQINLKNPLTQFNAGQALLASGRFVDARDTVRRAVELSPPNFFYRELVLQTMRQLEDCDLLRALEARLPAILEGKEKPVNAAEALKFAWLCQVKLRFAAAAGLYTDSFATDPKAANDLSAGYRLNAARCAALAAAGWGLDSPKPGDTERALLRSQTLEWLRADLTAWEKRLTLANQETRSAVRRTITLWLRDFRFFAVREKEELAKLPETERIAWEKLWADTEAFRIETRATHAPERWADSALRVVEGLELWLDASRLNAARQTGGLAPLKAGDEVETWFDNTGKGRHVGQAVQAARPQLVRVGQDWLIRFDGIDDHLRCTGLKRSLDACTVFVVAAPHANPGGHRAFLAANAVGKNDAQTGFNLDMGPGATAQFDHLNVEGAGFSGIQNLLDRPGSFGTLHVLELVADPGQRTVRLILDGRPSGERSFAPSPISLDEVTVGARYTSLRGALSGDIAEVLIYNRVLSAGETKAVRQYLDRKYAKLREALPAALKLPGAAK